VAQAILIPPLMRAATDSYQPLTIRRYACSRLT
jgi:hypothetical protein